MTSSNTHQKLYRGILMLILSSTGLAGTAFGADEIHWTLTGQTSVTFDWRGAETTIRYGLSAGSYTNTVTGVAPTAPNIPFSSAGPFWEARLTGLQENTVYHYQIGTGPDHTFRTPLARGSTAGFTVFAEGDIGESTSYKNMPIVQSLIGGGAFALLVGDLTYSNAHGQAHVDPFFNDIMVWSQDMAAMPAWGNHEWDQPTNACGTTCGLTCSTQVCDDLRNYKGRWDFPNPQTSPGSPAVSAGGEDWYWFDYGNVRFIAYPEPWSGAWADWATRATTLMDAAQADPVITFIVSFGHRPSYSSGHHPSDTKIQGYLNTLGTAHSKYVLDIAGHSHNYERTYPQNGVIHLTVGTGGANLEQDGTCLWATCTQPAWSAFRAFYDGVMRLQFSATGIKGDFICGPAGGGTNEINGVRTTCTMGSVIDTFSIGTTSPGGDTTAPAVSVTAPAGGATLSATVTLQASASDNVGVIGVQFKFDGGNVGVEDTTAPYSFAFDTTTIANGAHQITASARDAAGNSATSSSIAVTISNSTADATPPNVSITSPAGGATLSATVTLQASASDNVAVAGVQFKRDGVNLGAEDTAAPYSAAFDTTTVSDGAHLLTAVARDTTGNTATSSAVSVTTSNATTGGVTLVTDPTLVFSVPGTPKPAYLVPVTEPTFGTTVTRIANDPTRTASWSGPPAGTGTWGADARHHYSKDQPWNSDGTLMTLQNSGTPSDLYLDGETYLPRYGVCGNYGAGDDRWHPSPAHPHERINVSGTRLEWFDIVTCTQTRVWTLPFSVDYLGAGEGNPSLDGRFVALADAKRVFVVDMDPQSPQSPYPGNKRIGPASDVSACGLASGCVIDWVSVSASGRYVIVNYNGQHPRVYDVNPTTLALTARPMASTSLRCSGGSATQGYIYDLGHADLTLNPFDANEDVLVGQEHCSNSGKTINGQLIGGVVLVRLKDGVITSLTDPSNEAYPHHVSARNLDRPGWVYVGYMPAAGARFNDEIVAVKMDGSHAVERLAHKHSAFSGCYRCESHAVPSRDGKRVVWASNWADNCGTGCGSTSDIKDYVVDTRTGVVLDTTPPTPPSNFKIVP